MRRRLPRGAQQRKHGRFHCKLMIVEGALRGAFLPATYAVEISGLEYSRDRAHGVRLKRDSTCGKIRDPLFLYIPFEYIVSFIDTEPLMKVHVKWSCASVRRTVGLSLQHHRDCRSEVCQMAGVRVNLPLIAFAAKQLAIKHPHSLVAFATPPIQSCQSCSRQHPSPHQPGRQQRSLE